MIKVSVIVTVYNGERYLKECLDSICNQSLNDIEIICVDDASTDSTPEILKEYSENICVITNDNNIFAGNSRNVGMKYARGEYLVFLDADDLYEPCMLEEAYLRAKKTQADIVIWQENILDVMTGKISGYPYAHIILNQIGEAAFSPERFNDKLFMLWNGWAWDKMFRREFILSEGLAFQGTKTSNDGLFVHAAMALAQRISFIQKVNVHHQTGITGSVSESRDSTCMNCILYLRELKTKLQQKILFSMYKNAYINWSTDYLYWNYRTLSEEARSQLKPELIRFFRDELHVDEINPNMFYNNYYRYIAGAFGAGRWDELPVNDGERWVQYYSLLADETSRIIEKNIESGYRIIIWGASLRAKAFLNTVLNYRDSITVVDINPSKWGTEIIEGIRVYSPDEIDRRGMSLKIIVLNPAIVMDVIDLYAESGRQVEDIDTFLKYGLVYNVAGEKSKGY